MDKVSKEILALVFKYLHYREKLVCKLVCRTWANILRPGLDLETVAINKTGGSYSIQTLIRRVSNEPTLGRKCKRLVISESVDMNIVAKLFPNLNFFGSWYSSFDNVKGYSCDENNDVFQHWYRHLETLISFDYDQSFYAFFDTGVFHRLTKLALTSDWNYEGPQLDRLKSAPNLKVLCLRAFHFDLVEWEQLHVDLPLLQSIELINCTIETDWNEEIPRNILPANEIKSLEIDFCPLQFEFTMALSQYIVSKYPHLEKFAFTTFMYDLDELDDVDQAYTSAFTHLICERGNNLKSFRARVSRKIPLLYTELNKRDVCLEELNVNLYYKARVLWKITKSDTSSHLTSLSLAQVPPLKFNVFKRLCNLKKLRLSFKSKRINQFLVELDMAIKDLPVTLEDLGLSCVELRLSIPKEENSKPHHYPDSNISHLRIKNANITANLSCYLSDHFKRLHSLIINQCDTEFNLELPAHHFSYAYFALNNQGIWIKDPKTGGVTQLRAVNKFFKVTIGNKIHRVKTKSYNGIHVGIYSRIPFFDKHDRSMYDACEPLLSPDDDKPHFHFKCASIRTLVYEGCIVLV